MSKKLLWALLLIALTIIILILNQGGGAAVSLGGRLQVEGSRSAVYFAFTALGVVIGVLIK